MTPTRGNHVEVSRIGGKRSISGLWVGTILLTLLVVLLGSLLWLYVAQTGLGHWQVDEFRYFADHRLFGWKAYFDRLYVSPRPLSELSIYAYGTAVLSFDRDFIRPALLLVWSGSLVSIVVAAWATLPRSPVRALAAIALGAAPMTFVLVIAPVTEMFYWPVATVAYVPCVAALTALLFLLTDQPDRTRRGWCCAALLVSALNHEIGAAFAIGFAAAATAFAVRDWSTGTRPGWQKAGALWWSIPAIVGLLIMLALVLFRSQYVDLGADTKPYTGRLFASAGAAGWQMMLDVVTSGQPAEHLEASVGVLGAKLMFAVGFAAIWLRWGQVRPNRWHAAMVAGLSVAVFFSLLAAYYHYGDLCCERHASARQWLIELILILGASTLLARWPTWRGPKLTSVALGPLLVMASLLPVILQIPAFRADFSVVAMAQKARVRTWGSGLAVGSSMEFYMPPDSGNMLIHGTSVPVGTYDVAGGSTDPNDLPVALGTFFRKDVITACQAWQTHQSFQIDGKFIPACPPHAGPPDIIFDTTKP